MQLQETVCCTCYYCYLYWIDVSAVLLCPFSPHLVGKAVVLAELVQGDLQVAQEQTLLQSVGWAWGWMMFV
jgi:hypothetical protein